MATVLLLFLIARVEFCGKDESLSTMNIYDNQQYVAVYHSVVQGKMGDKAVLLNIPWYQRQLPGSSVKCNLQKYNSMLFPDGVRSVQENTQRKTPWEQSSSFFGKEQRWIFSIPSLYSQKASNWIYIDYFEVQSTWDAQAVGAPSQFCTPFIGDNPFFNSHYN